MVNGPRTLIVISTLLLTPVGAQAELKGMRPVAFAVYQAPEQCAVSLKVTDSVGGMTDGTETLKLGASFKYTFAGGGFSPGSFNVGSHVLYASPSFASKLNLKADISIPDADCAAFNTSGGEISFDGSLGKNPGLFKLLVPASFGTNKALDADGKTTDLAAAAILLYGFSGNWSVGTGTAPAPAPGDDGDSGGCAVSGRSTPRGAWLILLLGALVLVGARRRGRSPSRRRRARPLR